MEKEKSLQLEFLIIALTFAISAIIISSSFAVRDSKQNKSDWVLHSYGNNVALYKDDEIIEIYNTVYLDTLPKADRKQFENGILFHTKKEALMALEDYDG